MQGFTNIDDTLVTYRLTNVATFQYYAMRLANLAKTMYKWENLPEGVNEIMLEEFLLLHGGVCFAKDDITDELIALPAVPNGNLDMYGFPTKWRMYGMNGYNLEVTNRNSVMCYDNYNRRPILRDLLMFAKRMEIIERTMDINIQGQKTPYIMRGTKQQIKTLKELYEKMEANAPVIFADKSLELNEALQVTPTTTPFIAADLQNIKRNIWNEAMTFLGVQNANTEKRERLVEEEAVGNKGMIDNQANIRLKPRQEAADKINKMFGTNIKVRLNVDYEEEIKFDIQDDELPEGGEE